MATSTPIPATATSTCSGALIPHPRLADPEVLCRDDGATPARSTRSRMTGSRTRSRDDVRAHGAQELLRLPAFPGGPRAPGE